MGFFLWALFPSGAVIGYLCYWWIHIYRLGRFQALGIEIITRAETEAETMKKNHELEMQRMRIRQEKELEEVLQKEKRKFAAESERLKQREDKLERRMGLVEKKLTDTDKREAILLARREQLEEEKHKVSHLKEKLIADLEKLSGLTANEAKEHLLAKISEELKHETANLTRKCMLEAKEECERKAISIITTAITRLAVPTVSDVTVVTVPLPNDEMKGRIIGREGRNIRALEHATGVNFLIDDTPGAVVLSGFDPVRKQVAKMAIQDLIDDGRIHPTRIEEAVDKANVKIQKQIEKYGQDAAFRAGAADVHPELILLLGKLKFRYSYGQNVLEHSLEVSHLMGIMAAELNLNIEMSKRIGLLHDMGKAVTHEIEGSHAMIGHDFALKYGESEAVANGIGAHHEEIEPKTPEAWLCYTADRISATRPGARIEAVEEYVKRLKKLEKIALDFEGIEKAYAMQAGREVRVVVLPHLIDDQEVFNLARKLSKKIEDELTYPGKIKVTVIREQRAVEYAL